MNNPEKSTEAMIQLFENESVREEEKNVWQELNSTRDKMQKQVQPLLTKTSLSMSEYHDLERFLDKLRKDRYKGDNYKELDEKLKANKEDYERQKQENDERQKQEYDERQKHRKEKIRQTRRKNQQIPDEEERRVAAEIYAAEIEAEQRQQAAELKHSKLMQYTESEAAEKRRDAELDAQSNAKTKARRRAIQVQNATIIVKVDEAITRLNKNDIEAGFYWYILKKDIARFNGGEGSIVNFIEDVNHNVIVRETVYPFKTALVDRRDLWLVPYNGPDLDQKVSEKAHKIYQESLGQRVQSPKADKKKLVVSGGDVA